VLVEFGPALNTETFFETMYGLARDGKLDEHGTPPVTDSYHLQRLRDLQRSGGFGDGGRRAAV
jgi:hypothetical protein